MIKRKLQEVIESKLFAGKAILQNFAPLALRQDVGALWENFFVSERLKMNEYACRRVNRYFWRTSQQQEIDYIEEYDGAFSLFEMKWNPKKANVQFPSSFLAAYNVREQAVVTPQNRLEWLVDWFVGAIALAPITPQ